MNCTDSAGADVMAGYKKVHGLVETIDLTFTSINFMFRLKTRGLSHSC